MSYVDLVQMSYEEFPSNTILRRLFEAHLQKVDKALDAIWKESPEEEELILECFSFPKEEIQKEVTKLKETLVKLEEFT